MLNDGNRLGDEADLRAFGDNEALMGALEQLDDAAGGLGVAVVIVGVDGQEFVLANDALEVAEHQAPDLDAGLTVAEFSLSGDFQKVSVVVMDSDRNNALRAKLDVIHAALTLFECFDVTAQDRREVV